jgi:ribosomal protein S18 acetylase RimI-like enzyme
VPVETLEVRRVTEDDWRALKHLRLAALLDEPTAYCERWVDAAALDDDAWRARAVRGAEGGDSFQVMAWDGGRPVATAVGFVADDVAWLAAVHVAPDLRGRGLHARLVAPVAAWAGTQGAPSLHLEVHEDNARAQAAYRRLGFVLTGRRRPYPLDETAHELEMALALRPA